MPFSDRICRGLGNVCEQLGRWRAYSLFIDPKVCERIALWALVEGFGIFLFTCFFGSGCCNCVSCAGSGAGTTAAAAASSSFCQD